MNLPGGITIGRKKSGIQEQAQDYMKTLKEMGVVVKTGFESAGRHEELAALDEFIRSPLTAVYDKIEYIDSLICRNLQWGLGRTDQFWDFVFINWREIYSVWLIYNSFIGADEEVKVQVEYKELRAGITGKAAEWESHMKVLSGNSVMYLFLNKHRYSDINILSQLKVEKKHDKFVNPNEDAAQYRKDVNDFGLEVVLQCGWLALNYIYHPDHINANHVLVLAGAQNAPQYNVQPTGGNPAKPSGPRNPGIQET